MVVPFPFFPRNCVLLGFAYNGFFSARFALPLNFSKVIVIALFASPPFSFGGCKFMGLTMVSILEIVISEEVELEMIGRRFILQAIKKSTSHGFHSAYVLSIFIYF